MRWFTKSKLETSFPSGVWKKIVRFALPFGVLLLAIQARAEPAMWVVREKGATIYLVGTLHLLRHQTEWSSPKLKKALEESKELWIEVADIDNQAAALPLIGKYGFDQEHALSTKLSAAQQEKLKKVAAIYGLSPATLEQMNPWMVALTFAVLPLQKAGFDPDAGVDRSLKNEAEKRDEKISGFETMEEQVRFFAELPEKEQVAYLEQSLDDAEEGVALFDKLAEAWLRGDNKTIGDLIDGEIKAKAPEIYQKFLVARNIRWSERIAGFLKEPTVRLIAIGAGHLAGDDSVQAQLAKRGIKAEPY